MVQCRRQLQDDDTNAASPHSLLFSSLLPPRPAPRPLPSITFLESQLDKLNAASCQKDIDLARERDRCRDLTEETAQLRTASDACHTQLRTLGDTNDGLRTDLSIKENEISNLSAELATLRKEFALREQALASKVTTLDETLAHLRIQLEESRAETNSSSLSLSQSKEEMRLAKENEALAKERLVNTEKECAGRIASIIQRETEVIAAATSDLEARLRIAEERARVAEEREEHANTARRKSEMEAADLRNQNEEKVCRAKEHVKEDYEKLLQSKDAEIVVINKVREADALQMDDLRRVLANQEAIHKAELESHATKINEMSCNLRQARRNLDSERKLLSELKIDLEKAQTRLDVVTRQGQEDERAWEQKKTLLEDEISLLKEELEMQRKGHKEELSDYANQIRQGRAREVDLEERLSETEKKYRAERKNLQERVEEGIRSVFAE